MNKVKLFFGPCNSTHIEKFEKDINTWLYENNQIEIINVISSISESEMAARQLVVIHYKEEENKNE